MTNYHHHHHLHAPLRSTPQSSSSSSSQTFTSKLLLLLTLLPLSLAALAFILQWRGGIPDPTTRWSPPGSHHLFPGMDASALSSAVVHSTPSDCLSLGRSASPSFPYYQNWKFDSVSNLRPKVCSFFFFLFGFEVDLVMGFACYRFGFSGFLLLYSKILSGRTVWCQKLCYFVKLATVVWSVSGFKITGSRFVLRLFICSEPIFFYRKDKGVVPILHFTFCDKFFSFGYFLVQCCLANRSFFSCWYAHVWKWIVCPIGANVLSSWVIDVFFIVFFFHWLLEKFLVCTRC